MTFRTMTAAAALAMLVPAFATADPDAKLVVNGEIEMVTETEAPEHLEGLRTIRSGWTFRTEETQALQMDDFDNPAMIFVDQARDVWNTVEGDAGESCASCHGEPESLRGLRAELPKWNEEKGEVYTAEMYINDCRTERMGAEPWGWDSQPMKNMTALISSVSRGMTVDVAIDGPVREAWERGKEIYYTRYGQLELACANCHEDNYDNYIRADHLSQGHINGFPTYRLKQANLVSKHNRFRGCIRDTRGVPYAIGSEDFVALELYVASRGNGLSVEGPAVRN
ncbi:sulfur oxidation c-type cytochrome SoxA [Rhodosalinus halophilus]|uniref:SoxAX cytochrome complex subunit A n=1 Tax=Rhodosalinus halophilus TaxID=2259333 RepID=A0A365U3X5_9RHOB|nr:sulfur oxidation c-type cytochrome SoxA [Rhodosalinus halophilus]RBI82778.1 sulfur oxidation c-type cytochrome SoxA [Rhodosalinus halophilus]